MGHQKRLLVILNKMHANGCSTPSVKGIHSAIHYLFSKQKQTKKNTLEVRSPGQLSGLAGIWVYNLPFTLHAVDVMDFTCLRSVFIKRITGQGHSGVIIGVDGLAEVNRVLEFLPQDGTAGVAGHLQQEEACVALWQEVIRWVVLIQHLWIKDSA